MSEWTRNNYSDSDTSNMRRDAIARVQEMQRRARHNINNTNRTLTQTSSENTPIYVAPEPDELPVPPPIDTPHTPIQPGAAPVISKLNTGLTSGKTGLDFSPKNLLGTMDSIKNNLTETIENTIAGVTSPLTDIMDKFGIDSDKLIIIGVMLILLNEKGDKTLLLALGYLLLT